MMRALVVTAVLLLAFVLAFLYLPPLPGLGFALLAASFFVVLFWATAPHQRQ